MKGCRDLSDNEFELLMDYFAENDQLRDRTLFSVQHWAGYRIKEALSLKVKDVFHMKQSGAIKPVEQIHVSAQYMKGSSECRKIYVHRRLCKDLMDHLEVLQDYDFFCPDMYLFQSRKGKNKPISYVQAWRVLNKAFKELGITGNVATHSLRKDFANRMYEKTDYDIVATMKLMGHKSTKTTLSYISVDEEKLKQAVLA